MLTPSRTILRTFNQTGKPPILGLLIRTDRRGMQQLPDRIAKYERALAVVMRIHQMAGLQNIPLPLTSRSTISRHLQENTADLPTFGGDSSSLTSIDQVVDKVASSKLINLPSPSSISIMDRIGKVPAPTSPTRTSRATDFHALPDRSSLLPGLPLPSIRNDDVMSPSSFKYVDALRGGNPVSKKSLMLNKITANDDLRLSRSSQRDGGNMSVIAPPGSFRTLTSSSASAKGYGHLSNAITISTRSGGLTFAKSGSTPSSPLPVLPTSGFVRSDIQGGFSSRRPVNSGTFSVLPPPPRGIASMMSDHPEVKSGSARSRQTIALEPSHEQVILGHPAAPSSISAMSSSDALAGTKEAITTPQVINLTGSIMVDGRRLAQVTASTQAREISLPPRGQSRVNLRVVPIYSGIQIPS